MVHFWKVFIFLCFLLPVSYERSISSDPAIDQVKEKENAARFRNKMKILNKLQADIFGVTLPDEDDTLTGTETDSEENPYLFEGDIILTEEQLDQIIEDVRQQHWVKNNPGKEILLPKERTITSNLTERWTFPISFFIDTSTGVDAAAVTAGIKKWEEETCVRFTKKTVEPTGNALIFKKGNGCYSNLGKFRNNPQEISIGNGCTGLGTVTHEIAHALGVFHEQSRYDRDSYVKINNENIQEDQKHNFAKVKLSEMLDFGVGYDYGSIMHYAPNAFATNRKYNSITTTDPLFQNTIGQFVTPSFEDIKKMNFAYCNSTCRTTLKCTRGGYTDPNNCNRCKCPGGFGGPLCATAQSSGPCGTNVYSASTTDKTLSAMGLKLCYFLIRAPAGKKVQLQITNNGLYYKEYCPYSYVEVRYKTDLSRLGPRFCDLSDPSIVSETNEMIVVYQGEDRKYLSSYIINYRAV